MEILHAMEHEGDEAERKLDFQVNLKTPGVLDQIGFVVFLARKFEAEIADVGQISKDAEHPFGTIELRFADADRFKAAESFCEENLTESGLTVRDTQDEVRRADFHGAEAQELHRRMFAAPLAEEPSRPVE